MTTNILELLPRAWVLTADHSQAHLFESLGGDEPLLPLEVLANPDARAPEASLHRHARGRRMNSATRRQSALGARRSGRHFTSSAFAQRVCRRLEAARIAGQLRRLLVVAQPEMLGLIRGNLSPGVARLVTATVARDPAHFDEHRVRAVLEHSLP